MPSIDISSYQPPRKRPKKSSATSMSSVANFLNKDISFGQAGLSDKKKEAFYLELSTLLLSGIDLKSSLDLILVDKLQKKEQQLFEKIRNSVISGTSLSEAMLQTDKFSKYEYFSIRIGEETGRLAEVMAELAKYFKSKISQRRKVISAITYPIIVLCTSVAAVFFMLQFVVPMFADVFQRFGGQLPSITAFILSVSKAFNAAFGYILVFFITVVVVLLVNRQKLWYRQFFSHLILKLPVVGEIVKKVYLARFSNTMSLLVGTDTPLLHSISLVKQMINFYPIESSLGIVEERILKGASLHESLSQFSFYPAKFVQLIKVGEEVNRLEYFFKNLAEQYTEEVEFKTSTISSSLEPLIIIFLGLVVGVILIAMYLPMFQMSNSF